MRYAFLLFLLAPTFAFAAIQAGFPTAPLWLSKTDIIDGESIVIYTVLYNSSEESLTGDVEFLVDGELIGTKGVSAAAGTTQIVSEDWTAKEGSHAFSARLVGADAALTSTVTGTTTVSVAAKPPPPEPVVKTIAAAGALEQAIASTTPVVQEFASTTFATTESIREKAVSALEKLASSTAPQGEVLGAADEQPVSAEENAAASFDIGSWIQNIWQAILGALLFVARSPLWFYIAAAFVLFLIIQFVRAALSDTSHSRDR
jgi:hypothetical protein